MIRFIIILLITSIVTGCNDHGRDAFSRGMALLTGHECVKDEELAVAWFEKAASAGNADAKFMLGSCRERGVGTQKDVNLAASWYFEALKAGREDAADLLAEILIINSNVVCDVSIVTNCLEKIARTDDGRAYYQIARLHNIGRFSPDDEGGREYMLKSAKRGYTQGKVAYGFSVLTDHDQSVKTNGLNYLTEAAEQNDLEAQRILAHCYADGFLLDRDDASAIKWEIRAAKQGDGGMLTRLGRRYWSGYGVETDRVEAVRFWKKALKANDPDGANIIGELYNVGYDELGVQKDVEFAFNCFKVSANGGYVNGIFNLGYAYFHGLGVEPNKLEAVECYKKAAIKGHSEAQRLLGVALLKGVGVEKDEDKARFWLRKSAEQGNASAMTTIAWTYYDSDKSRWDDKEEAMKWLKRAADAGDEQARESLKILK